MRRLQLHTGSIPAQRERSPCSHSLEQSLSLLCFFFFTFCHHTESHWRRRMMRGPAELCACWGPHTSTLHRHKDPHWPHRYFLLAVRPRRNVKQPWRKSLRGRRLRLRRRLQTGLLEQHVPGGWTSTAAAPEPHTAGGCLSVVCSLCTDRPSQPCKHLCWCSALRQGSPRRCRVRKHHDHPRTHFAM